MLEALCRQSSTTLDIVHAEDGPPITQRTSGLETVPDLAAAARLLDLADASDAAVREALGSGFPKHPLHKIVCIGALVASRQPEGWRVDALGAPHTGERSEGQLIRDFIEKIGQLRPQLITFNGHSFDLPVLRYRANRVPAAGLRVRQYFHRYTEDALDLCDVLGSYVPGAKVKLDDVSRILGLAGKCRWVLFQGSNTQSLSTCIFRGVTAAHRQRFLGQQHG
jgi:predicted PolB exonuclease-like 3'-5' exonuclease